MYTVLIVEDELLVRRGIKLSIEESALPVEVIGDVADGREGFEFMLRHEPDILVTDLRLPGMDGLELIRKLRARSCNARVLIISCLEDFATLREAMTHQISHYLLKATMTGSELTHALAQVVRELDDGAQKPPDAAAQTEKYRQEIAEIIQYMRDHPEEPLDLHAAAAKVSFSANYFSNLFTQETGFSFVTYQNQMRLTKAQAMLRDSDLIVQEIAWQCGFRNASYFNRIFRRHTGMSPGRWRKAKRRDSHER